MPNEPAPAPSAPIIPPDLGKFILDPLNHAMAAASRQALKQGVPTHSLIEFFLNHMASVVAMVEPAGARQVLLEQLVGSFAPMVQRHVDARFTTPGGLLIPKPGEIVA